VTIFPRFPNFKGLSAHFFQSASVAASFDWKIFLPREVRAGFKNQAHFLNQAHFETGLIFETPACYRHFKAKNDALSYH